MDYRLAPEHPYPAGLRDVLAVLGEVRAEAGREAVVLVGDSAGAELALSAGQVARHSGAPVDGLVLLCPWLDLRCGSPTFTAPMNTDTMFPLEGEDLLQLRWGLVVAHAEGVIVGAPVLVEHPRARRRAPSARQSARWVRNSLCLRGRRCCCGRTGYRGPPRLGEPL
ncbi:hypothetical protein GCM10009836_25000 [Pseudonocardia ailaonensis]|uniref:Alpha/beta hydrolase fold-3 domain-containing protein n=1 Tax=Pseudonocardia ailaonensis TaxID=367279 RepID=A0ABN2N077_9PSEU